MSLATIVPAAVMETLLARIAALFLAGAGGDSTFAREAARQMLAAFSPRTADEICLATNILCFSFQALEALSQATDPETSLTRILRLRSGAVSLSREADKARRTLAQLQKARRSAEPPHYQSNTLPIPDTSQIRDIRQARDTSQTRDIRQARDTGQTPNISPAQQISQPNLAAKPMPRTSAQEPRLRRTASATSASPPAS